MIAFLSVLALLAAQPAAAPEDVVLPAELCRGFWLLPVEFEPGEDGQARTLWFLHDTGASRTVVDPDSIEQLSGQRLEDDQRIALTDARSGRLKINRLSGRVTELDHISIALGRPIDGIMSVYALEDFLLILDYPAGEMRLRAGELPRPDGRTVFSTRGPDGRPWLRTDLAGRERPLLIDSGGGGLTFAVNHIERFNLAAPPRILSSAVRFDRIERRPIARLDGDAMVAGLRIEAPVIEEVPRSELLGGEILRYFVVTLDQANRRVRMERAVEGPIAPLDHYASGATLRPTAAGIEVLEVCEGAPLAAAGVVAGDVITHFDDVPAAERGCTPPPSSTVPGTTPGPTALTIRRGGVEQVLQVENFPVLPAPPR